MGGDQVKGCGALKAQKEDRRREGGPEKGGLNEERGSSSGEKKGGWKVRPPFFAVNGRFEKKGRRSCRTLGAHGGGEEDFFGDVFL